ncbi:MAG: universal stress protein [Sulfitobacter sp.]|jgi:nucleotide-binding universal stress UspA family protein|nr:universal stress protein [Sulfitobacter sp.]
MGLKTLLVCLTTPENSDALLKLAVPLARKHNAHLIGLHTVEALLVYPGIAIHIPEPAFASFHESQKKASDAIEKVFRKHTALEDFPSEFRLVRAEAVYASERMVESARVADLVIMAQEDRTADRYDQRNAQQHVIRESGRPVIVVPPDYDGPEIGANILLGWNDTKEAARASHDMLTVAQPGASVTVLRVSKSQQDMLKDSVGVDLTEMLARHDLRAELEQRNPMGDSIADALNKAAFEKGADLIVTGAFSHSKAYEFVLGATSPALLHDAKLPVLFSQ